MNDLMINQVLTMSSREIATLCDKRHPDVKRDIEVLAEQLEVDVSKFAHIYLDSMNRQQTEYLLDKDTCLCLVAGYNAKLRMAIIKRWQQLEQATAPRLPTTYLEALEALLASEKAKLTLEQQASINAPKVAHYDRVVARTNLVNATHVASKLKLSAVKLNRHLCELGVYNQAVKRGKVFNTWFIDKGYGQMKQTELGYDQALFTHAGEMWVIEMMISEGVGG